MPLFIPSSWYQVSFIMEATGIQQVAVNTLGLEHSGPNFTADAAGVEALWAAKVMVQINSGWVFTRAVWRVQEGAVRDSVHNTPGGINSDALPPNCAVLVQKTTGQPGRMNRGRWFLPGVAISGVDGGGRLSAGLKLDWQKAVSDFILGLPQTHFAPGILHNVSSLANTINKDPTFINDFVVQGKIATQRRRLRD